MRGDIRSEWDETKQHDVLFLLTVRPPDAADLALLAQDGSQLHPAEKFGLVYVRGCEVIEVKDEGTLHCTTQGIVIKSDLGAGCCYCS